jgi:hypothetical protein
MSKFGHVGVRVLQDQVWHRLQQRCILPLAGNGSFERAYKRSYWYNRVCETIVRPRSPSSKPLRAGSYTKGYNYRMMSERLWRELDCYALVISIIYGFMLTFWVRMSHLHPMSRHCSTWWWLNYFTIIEGRPLSSRLLCNSLRLFNWPFVDTETYPTIRLECVGY